MASVECVQCGTRNEISSEVTDGLQGEHPHTCGHCGTELPREAAPPDAPLNEIFNEFERTFHPSVAIGRHVDDAVASSSDLTVTEDDIVAPPPSLDAPAAESGWGTSVEAVASGEPTGPSADPAASIGFDEPTEPVRVETAAPSPVEMMPPPPPPPPPVIEDPRRAIFKEPLPVVAQANEASPALAAEVNEASPALAPTEVNETTAAHAPAAEANEVPRVLAPAAEVNEASAALAAEVNDVPLALAAEENEAPPVPAQEVNEAPPPSLDRLALAGAEPPAAWAETALASSSFDPSTLRASLVDSGWSTPMAPMVAEPAPLSLASEQRPSASEERLTPPMAEVPVPVSVASMRAIESNAEAAAAPGVATNAEPAIALPPPRAHTPTLPWGESGLGEIVPPTPNDSGEASHRGPPPPPAWALAEAEAASSDTSALARALAETAQRRLETGAHDVIPEPPFSESAKGGTAQVDAVSPSVAESVLETQAGVGTVPAVLAAAVEGTQRIAPLVASNAPAAASDDSVSLRIRSPKPLRLASDAPVVSALDESELRPPPSFFGEAGSKRRSAVMGAAAGLAVISSFFLGRSSVSESPKSEPVAAVAAAKLEAPAPLAAPPSEPEKTAVEAAAAKDSAPSAASNNLNATSPVVVVNTGKQSARAAAAIGSAQGATAPFDAQAAGRALADAAARATSCRRLDDPGGRATVTVTFAPSGKVAGANIAGIRFSGATMRNCMGSMFHSARIPAFSGAPVTVKKTLKI